MRIETISEHRCYDGVQGYYKHFSGLCGGAMRFAVFQPPKTRVGRVPVLYYLAGLTCTEETFVVKAGAQRIAAQLGLMLVATDTSPRESRFPDDEESWDFGQGAGFYVDATREPWRRAYRMESYVTGELPEVIVENFSAHPRRQGILGHSMGGHGALTLALRHPKLYRSVSAIAPVAAAAHCPWGQKAFSRYFGNDEKEWLEHDASELMARKPLGKEILIDQGLADPFLEAQLQLPLFEAACQKKGQPLTLRRHAGYDHGYFFIQTFIGDHLKFHASRLSD